MKAFLSHSSADKERYVRIVAKKLGLEHSVYDEYTFEAGMQPLEEILRGLSNSEVFVVFISEAALSSRWVQKELLLAHQRLGIQKIQRIFPIIIDPSITHADARIPQWMRDEYNLKYVSRPTVAARRIRQRLREISWIKNPRLEQRYGIFVGRNELIRLVEERLDDFDQEVPVCLMASGLPLLGRSALLRHAIIKAGVVRSSFEFPTILLRREESLEDLILKLFDLGFSQSPYPINLMKIDSSKRIDIAVKIVNDIQQAKEIVLIRDEGCIIDREREFRPWFDQILSRVSGNNHLTFLATTRFRPHARFLRDRPHVFALDVPELSYNERRGLFKRLIDTNRLVLGGEDFNFFGELFQGHPDQIRYAVDMIYDVGLAKAREEANQITEFNSDKAATVLAKYSDHQSVLDFLFLLSEFEFISLDFLFSIIPESDYGGLLDELVASCICDYIGIEKDFVRMNDTIRDYVKRNRIALPKEFRHKLNHHLNEFLKKSDEVDRDVSDILYSLKEGVKAGLPVPEQYLIPSHFLRSMRELYQKRGQLDKVISLADRLLVKGHLLDPDVAHDIRNYLCLSLARKRDRRMLAEVQKIHGPEHDFLLGFYYRLQGRAKDAIDSLTKCLDEPTVSTRAKRELVQVFLSIEDYDNASVLAKANYEENRRNAYHIQAYFKTLVNTWNAAESEALLQRLLTELEELDSVVAVDMACIGRAEFLAKCKGDYPRALDAINDACDRSPDAHYPLLTKAFMAARFHDITSLKAACQKLEEMSKSRSILVDSLVRVRAFILAIEGNLTDALALVETKLFRLPDESRRSLDQRLREMHKQVQQE